MVSILLVEDEEVTLKLLANILGKKFPQLTIHSAVNGREGLGLFTEHLQDVVITDINMPEMSGVQMIRSIRKLKPEAKVIVLTAGAVNADQEQAARKELEIDHYILKPINFEGLFAAVEVCLAGVAPPGRPGTPASLAGLLEALDGDREALSDLIGDFLASYPGHLQRISAAVRSGSASHLEKSAHQFKGSLGIFCRTEPLALTQCLMEMGERDALTQAPRTLELLEREMGPLVKSLREFTAR